jgi:hypothetical protein
VRILAGRARDRSMTILGNGLEAISKQTSRNSEMALCQSIDGSLPVCEWTATRLRMVGGHMQGGHDQATGHPCCLPGRSEGARLSLLEDRSGTVD